MWIKKLLTMLLGSAVMLAALAGCGDQNSHNDTSSSPAAESVSSSSDESKKNGGEPAMTLDNVKLLGRTYAAPSGEIWMGLSGTGVELEYTGSKLSITLRGNRNESDKMPRIGVFADGERIHDVCVSTQDQTVGIDGKGSTPVNVRVVKLSECSDSCCAIVSMDAHGGTIAKTASKQRRIEFIGDSITCGYGVDDSDLSHGFSTTTEDCTKAYSVKTAQALDADYSLVSYSGYGIVSGYTPDMTKDTFKLVPPHYDNYGFTESDGFGGEKPYSINWDFSSFKPDVIVICLGTNDFSYTGYDAQRQKEFTDCYVEFLGKVRSKNPDAKIVCTLGTMGTVLNGAMNNAVSQYSAETGDNNICSLDLPFQDMEADGCVIQGHPTETTHDKAAQLLSEKIRSEMNWQ